MARAKWIRIEDLSPKEKVRPLLKMFETIKPNKVSITFKNNKYYFVCKCNDEIKKLMWNRIKGITKPINSKREVELKGNYVHRYCARQEFYMYFI